MNRARNATYLAWLIAIAGTIGSLYFSQVLHLPPCILCWYQRIFMYPLVFIIGIGLWRNNRELPLYVLPLSLIGLGIAVYHNLLYYHIIPESLAPCSLGVSCTTKQIEWLGFITIPLLSLIGFTLVNACMVLALKAAKRSTHE